MEKTTGVWCFVGQRAPNYFDIFTNPIKWTWLVVEPTPLKNIEVSWDYYSQYMFQTTNQWTYFFTNFANATVSLDKSASNPQCLPLNNRPYFPWKFPQRNPTKLERFHQPTTWGCRLQVPIPYIRPNCLRPKFQGISPENMAKNMVNVYQKTMERSTMLFMAKSTNFLWQFSIAFCMFARG